MVRSMRKMKMACAAAVVGSFWSMEDDGDVVVWKYGGDLEWW